MAEQFADRNKDKLALRKENTLTKYTQEEEMIVSRLFQSGWLETCWEHREVEQIKAAM